MEHSATKDIMSQESSYVDMESWDKASYLEPPP